MCDTHKAIERLRADLALADAEGTPVEANREDVRAVLERVKGLEATWKVCAFAFENINNPSVIDRLIRDLEAAK